MATKYEEIGRVGVLAPEGDLSGAEVAAFRRAAESALEARRVGQLVVDLSRVSFAESAGLETLLWLRSKCDEHLGQLRLAGGDERLRSILRITRIDQRLDCFADVAAAIRTVS